MERPQSETGGKRRMEKNKERVQFLPPGRMLTVPPMARPPAAATNEVRLAAIAVELNIRLRSADMPGAMQEHAFRFSRALLDTNNLESKNPNPTHIAMSLKKRLVILKVVQNHAGSNSASSYTDTFADYISSSSSNSSSVTAYWESWNSSLECVDLGSETVVDKEVVTWEIKIKKADVESYKEERQRTGAPSKIMACFNFLWLLFCA
ncbi:hypothetical protein NC652_008873 [Populus alba x Populus x berolinensis]|nr:hypothetical protein NC652_008873 [Populus alba x Populus x berolinensis]